VAEPAAPAAGSPDDLKVISGIGPALEKKLHACGVAGFRDLATLSDADIERIEAVIKFAGRIRREDWIGQAKAHYLQKYGESL
jgi:predicted flap endonuclease-1-like 5' DNA nuclease